MLIDLQYARHRLSWRRFFLKIKAPPKLPRTHALRHALARSRAFYDQKKPVRDDPRRNLQYFKLPSQAVAHSSAGIRGARTKRPRPKIEVINPRNVSPRPAARVRLSHGSRGHRKRNRLDLVYAGIRDTRRRVRNPLIHIALLRLNARRGLGEKHASDALRCASSGMLHEKPPGLPPACVKHGRDNGESSKLTSGSALRATTGEFRCAPVKMRRARFCSVT